jgi:protein ImuB
VSQAAAPAPDLVRLAATLLTHAPRVPVDLRADEDGGAGLGLIWADARGLDARSLAHDLLAMVRDDGVSDACAGVASTPVAAELAAVRGDSHAGVRVVDAGRDREFVSLFPVDVLDPPRRVRPLLFGIGVSTCGALAELTRESVEVRLGADAVGVWRRARADDDRSDTLFAPMPRELPHASLDWMEYEVTDPARLLFVIHALLERVCDALGENGQGARELAVEFALSNCTTHTETLRASRATAHRQTWIRLVRNVLDRVKLDAAVTGIALRATNVAGREDKQGDLFDRGFATQQATEDVIARIVEDQGEVVVAPVNNGHPLLEQRTAWESVQRTAYSLQGRSVPGLTLQLSAIPQSIDVETVPRRDHFVPARYRDSSGWHEIVHAAGPDRVSGGKWDAARAYAREYFRCVTNEGVLVWLFRNGTVKKQRGPQWYLHGWWD